MFPLLVSSQPSKQTHDCVAKFSEISAVALTCPPALHIKIMRLSEQKKKESTKFFNFKGVKIILTSTESSAQNVLSKFCSGSGYRLEEKNKIKR